MTDQEFLAQTARDLDLFKQIGRTLEDRLLLMNLAQRAIDAEAQLAVILNDMAIDSDRSAALIAATTRQVADQCRRACEHLCVEFGDSRQFHEAQAASQCADAIRARFNLEGS